MLKYQLILAVTYIKIEYLTKKDLNYKPNAFEQAKFECSPLGKVFIDGLNKTDKKEVLLKRFKNIESKSNNQLLPLKNINKPFKNVFLGIQYDYK